MLKNTFGKSRSPSPFRTSRSVSPERGYKKTKKNIRKKRDRSNSRKRNSFGTTISRSPKRRNGNKPNNNKRKLPLHPTINYDSSSTINDENVDDDDDESTFNPTKEIESIDSRLNALQKFLRA